MYRLLCSCTTDKILLSSTGDDTVLLAVPKCLLLENVINAEYDIVRKESQISKFTVLCANMLCATCTQCEGMLIEILLH